ncbi:VWA domain-containing protein [Sulfuracidifex metallicus]|uniref:VWA domain-containing protein n=1 Tax=Sulfuracidifex metallicus DSM 6482 = JCM 9184 TaxID=523847 RepID=A0A6A9QKX9_SULME|nr:VWA domain-containing protein [Sulfuracidifex metallicus]MUN29927.1 VWA domain-containing protein [Sulfuracidifex metallicus DSM 6482 = JCM 9184]WOE51689.1 VWA domain-containing protein [Sulfuracidifex metallicus DSM 6482 = JCM 9184]
MVVSVKLTQSYTVANVNKPTESGVVVYIIPESAVTLTNTHFIIAVDNSPSMKNDNKLDTAMQAAQNFLATLPPGNLVTLMYFANHPHIIYQGPTGQPITIERKFEGTTRLHEALREIIRISSQNNMATKVILLTDGQSVDKTNVKDYKALQFPPYVQLICLGVGRDYNEKILKTLADMTGGLFYHVEDPNSLPMFFESQKSRSTAAYNLELDTPREFTPLNYNPPIRIPIVENMVAVYGTILVPPGKDPYTAKFVVKYIEPADGKEREVTKFITFNRGDEQEVMASVNDRVQAEIKYYRLLREYEQSLMNGNTESTRILQSLQEAAEQTRREDLIESTRKLSGDFKTDLSEITRKMRSQ